MENLISRNRFSKNNIKAVLMDRAISLVLLVLIIVIAIINPKILSFRVLRDILMQSSTKVIIALGMMLVILIGGVDLGASRLVGMAAVVSASLLQTPEYVRRFYPNMGSLPIIVPIFIAILIGAFWGVLNGIVVAKFQVPAFIATLGSMLIIYGVNSIYFNLPPNNSQPIGGLRSDFTFLGSGSIGPIPIIVIFAVVAMLIMWVLLNKTVFGKKHLCSWWK